MSNILIKVFLPKTDMSSSTSAAEEDGWVAAGNILCSGGLSGSLGAWGLVFRAGFRK